MKTQATAIIASFTIALLAAACESGTLAGEEQFDEPVGRVVSNIEASSLVVRPATDSAASVVWDVEYHQVFEQPTFDTWYADGELHIDLNCAGDCRGTVEVAVPVAADIVAENGAGGIEIVGISGDLDLQTGSGGIDGRDLGSVNVIADTGSGGIDLELSETPWSVELQTGSGGIDLRVPCGTYSVSVSAGSGSTSVENLVNDPASPNDIYAHAGSGSVRVVGD